MDAPIDRRFKRHKPTNANINANVSASARTQRSVNANQWSIHRIDACKYDSPLYKPPEDDRHRYLNFMARDFEAMVNNREFSDFTFTVNGVIYYAHKNILASRSPVFAAMFRSNMCETHTNNVVINDCDTNVFEIFLNYLYTADVSKLKQFACELFSIADKYEVMSLKKYCENSIEIENKNAIKVLIMAHLYNADRLKKNAIDHIMDNLRLIRTTCGNEFQQLLNDYPKLVNEMFAVIERMNNNRSTEWLSNDDYRSHLMNAYVEDDWFVHNGEW